MIHENSDNANDISPKGKLGHQITKIKTLSGLRIPVVGGELVSMPDKINFFRRTHRTIFGVCHKFQKSSISRDRLRDSRSGIDREVRVGPPGMIHGGCELGLTQCLGGGQVRLMSLHLNKLY